MNLLPPINSPGSSGVKFTLNTSTFKKLLLKKIKQNVNINKNKNTNKKDTQSFLLKVFIVDPVLLQMVGALNNEQQCGICRTDLLFLAAVSQAVKSIY